MVCVSVSVRSDPEQVRIDSQRLTPAARQPAHNRLARLASNHGPKVCNFPHTMVMFHLAEHCVPKVFDNSL